MSDHKTLEHEERLRAIAYQFIALYERWSEDRQEAVKRSAHRAALFREFASQVKAFKQLEPEVRQAIYQSLQQAVKSVEKSIGENLKQAALSATEETVAQLDASVTRAENTLRRYQQSFIQTQWAIIACALLTTVATCLLLVKFVIPDPLTDAQIKTAYQGQQLMSIWPKLTEKEHQRLLKLFEQNAQQGKQKEEAQ